MKKWATYAPMNFLHKYYLVEAELARVFRFLGLEEVPVEPKHLHVRKYAAPINPPTKLQLQQFYAPFNERLFRFLGEEIPEWERP